jgi:hypothetical protein
MPALPTYRSGLTCPLALRLGRVGTQTKDAGRPSQASFNFNADASLGQCAAGPKPDRATGDVSPPVANNPPTTMKRPHAIAALLDDLAMI